MTKHGHSRTTWDHCVFVKKSRDTNFFILLLCIDNMLIDNHHTVKFAKLQEEFSRFFSMKLHKKKKKRSFVIQD